MHLNLHTNKVGLCEYLKLVYHESNSHICEFEYCSNTFRILQNVNCA